MYHQYNIQNFYALPTLCLCVLYLSEREERLVQFSESSGWIYKIDLTLYNPVVIIGTTSLTFNYCTLCPHFIYMFCIYQRTNKVFCYLPHKLVFL